MSDTERQAMIERAKLADIVRLKAKSRKGSRYLSRHGRQWSEIKAIDGSPLLQSCKTDALLKPDSVDFEVRYED